MDPNDEVEISATIAEAKRALLRLEGSAARINGIATDLSKPLEERKNIQFYAMTLKFVSFVVICVTALLGLYGMLFFQYSDVTSSSIEIANKRIAVLEARVNDLRSQQTPTHP